MANFLRTATPEGDWRSFRFTNLNTFDMGNGLLYLQQETVGVPLVAQRLDANNCALPLVVPVNDEGVFIYHAEKIELLKVDESGHDFIPGDKVYWSGVAGAGVTPTYISGYYWIGICVWPSGAGETLVIIDLKGDKASLTEPL